MKEILISKNDAGQRLDRFLSKALPLMPASLLQKLIRTKDIKLNGARCERHQRLSEGDVLRVYADESFFERPAPDAAFMHIKNPSLGIVYEDENILLLDKRPGMLSHPDDREFLNTLITHVQAYLYQKGEFDPALENSFMPALCNRIDRGTGGIVIAAKNAEAMRAVNEKIRSREIKKLYLCAVHGHPDPPSGKLEGYLVKDVARNRVRVGSENEDGARHAVTFFRTLARRGPLALLECELMTGRTHQIRAQLASIGHPLLGDGKYGVVRKGSGPPHQALYSYKLVFSFKTGAKPLDYLKDRVFQVEKVDFLDMFY